MDVSVPVGPPGAGPAQTEPPTCIAITVFPDRLTVKGVIPAGHQAAQVSIPPVGQAVADTAVASAHFAESWPIHSQGNAAQAGNAGALGHSVGFVMCRCCQSRYEL